MALAWTYALGLLPLAALYVWHVNRALSGAPEEALRHLDEAWTEQRVRAAYEKARTAPTDVRRYLKPRTGRRYVVLGGSGMIGSWIVKHLLMRGESPAAIRILDLNAPTQPELKQEGIQFIKTNVADAKSVTAAFDHPWASAVAGQPLTVFHCVALIAFKDRKAAFLPPYLKVNLEGTRNTLQAAKNAGASVFIATSSASVTCRPPRFWLYPWQRWPTDIYQFNAKATVRSPQEPVSAYANCYAYSKSLAEQLVCSSDVPSARFRTGCIRPGHGVYAHQVPTSTNLVWTYLSSSSLTTWLWEIVTNFVDAQNVSIGHLAYEAALIADENTKKPASTTTPPTSSSGQVGGRTFFITDPNPAIRYQDLYKLLTLLAKARPACPQGVSFNPVPPGPLFVLSYLFEAYDYLQHSYLQFLPKLQGDSSFLQPATFNVCTAHFLIDNTEAEKLIGYETSLTTLEGFCRTVAEWNDLADRERAQGVKARMPSHMEAATNALTDVPKVAPQVPPAA